jgi:hypothetical protein
MKHDPSLGSFCDVGFPGMSTDPSLGIGRSLGVPTLGTSPGLGTARPRSLLRRNHHRVIPGEIEEVALALQHGQHFAVVSKTGWSG